MPDDGPDRPADGPAGLPAPAWAAFSVAGDGAVTYRRISGVHPVATGPGLPGTPGTPGEACRVEVSLNQTDRWGGRGWSRAAPTVRVGGLAYTLPEARRLVRAVEELLAQLP